MRRTLAAGVGAAALALATITVGGATGQAATTDSVSATPASWTPYLNSSNSTIRQLVPAGSIMYAVGTFTSIKTPSGHVYGRNNVFAFNASNGAVSSWVANTNGTVYSAAVSADGKWIYLGGTFGTVNGVSAPKLAKVSTSTGAVDRTFNAHANSAVKALLLSGSHLLVGGTFTSIGGVSRRALTSVSPTTGADDGYVDLNVSGVIPSSVSSTTQVMNFELNHGGTKLLAMGDFTSVAGQQRQHIFMVDLGTTAALDPWNSPLFLQPCWDTIPMYIQAAGWSPDDSKIVVAATGYKGTSPLCDAASMFTSWGTNLTPLWINTTGCDSLYSTALTTTNVYIGGHERWADNPNGCDVAGPGAVSRPGVGALGYSSGLATGWNPTRSRGHAADDMVFTAQGLWVASDNTLSSYYCANRWHPGLCMFPYG